MTRSYRRLAGDLGKFFLLFLAACALPALLAPDQPLLGMIVLTAGLGVAGLYGKRVRRRAGF